MRKNPIVIKVPNEVIPMNGTPRVNVPRNNDPIYAAPAIPPPTTSSNDMLGRISVATTAIIADKKYAEPAASAFEVVRLIFRVEIRPVV
jgi:hypothetical protein